MSGVTSQPFAAGELHQIGSMRFLIAESRDGNRGPKALINGLIGSTCHSTGAPGLLSRV